jgi:hypothetical protein
MSLGFRISADQRTGQTGASLRGCSWDHPRLFIRVSRRAPESLSCPSLPMQKKKSLLIPSFYKIFGFF